MPRDPQPGSFRSLFLTRTLPGPTKLKKQRKLTFPFVRAAGPAGPASGLAGGRTVSPWWRRGGGGGPLVVMATAYQKHFVNF